MKDNKDKPVKHGWFDVPGASHPVKQCWKCGCIKGYSSSFKSIVYTKDGKLYEKLPPCIKQLMK